MSAATTATMLADNDTDKSSPIGLFIVLLLVVAVYFLYRSMNKHMRNLPESFDPPVGQKAGTLSKPATADETAPPAQAAKANQAPTNVPELDENQP